MYIRYLTAAHQDILIKPILTVPDAPDGEYQFAGVPDGLGAFVLPGTEGTFELVVTHELRYNAGKRRAHACSGAFVSRWTIDTTHWNRKKGKGRIGVVKGRDQIRCVHHWVHPSEQYRTSKSVPIERLCSADLPVPDALLFVDEKGNKFGTHERIFLGAEETHTKYKYEHGRAFAHVLTGPRDGHTYELPHLGRGSFENALACPFPQKKTIVVLPDDAESHRVFGEPKDEEVRTEPDPCAVNYDHYNPTSEMYVYVGEKQNSADAEKSKYPLELAAAGLVGGTLYGVQVMLDGKPIKWEHREYGFGTKKYVGKAQFRLVNLGDRSKSIPVPGDKDADGCSQVAQDNPGIALQRDSITYGVTQFLRPEDGAWDPREGHQNKFYFGTTDSFDGNSRLFRLVFDDLAAVGDDDEPCGTIEILLNAREQPTDRSADRKYLFHSLDSITVNPLGQVLVQEDPGSESYLTRTLLYLPDDGSLYSTAEGNKEVFGRFGSHFLTVNEEAAGIIPVFDLLGEGWYLTAVQANVEEDWANKVLPGQLSYQEQLQLETDLVTPGQLCAVFIPKDITERKGFEPVNSVSLQDIKVCASHPEEYAGRAFVYKHGD